MKNIELSTNRLTLTNITLKDANDLFNYRSDSRIQKYQSFNPVSIHDAISFIEDNNIEFNKEGTWFQVGIFKENKLIGDIGIHFIGPENQQCEIGYTIDPTYQKNGYAKEALSRVLEYLFNDLQKHRIIASIDPNNEASLKLLEKLRFRKEGHFKKSILHNGKWEDDVIYALLHDEY